MVSDTSLETPQARSSDYKPHILIVDDEFPNRLLLDRILGDYHTSMAEDGHEALLMLQHETFDLVLLDIMMPEITGLTVLQELRNQPATADLPVILISALNQNHDIVSGLKAGANDYIVKPFDVDVIVARVETQLELKQAADLKKQAIADLEAAKTMKDRLLRIASHDMKAPLTNIGLAENLLRETLAGDPMIDNMLDIIQMAVQQMNTVIEDYLEIAAFQDSNMYIQRMPVEIAAVVHEIIMPYQASAGSKRITLSLEDLPGVWYVDKSRIEQVLNNLVSNAIKYSPVDTTVRIWSEMRPDNMIRLSVADQGPGIPANERDKLFKEFGKLSTRPTGNESSTGLGLWIACQIVRQHEGRIDVDCPASGGAVFWVELPAIE